MGHEPMLLPGALVTLNRLLRRFAAAYALMLLVFTGAVTLVGDRPGTLNLLLCFGVGLAWAVRPMRAGQVPALGSAVAWAAVTWTTLIGAVGVLAYLTWVVWVSELVDWWRSMPFVGLVMVAVQALAAYWLLKRPAGSAA